MEASSLVGKGTHAHFRVGILGSLWWGIRCHPTGSFSLVTIKGIPLLLKAKHIILFCQLLEGMHSSLALMCAIVWASKQADWATALTVLPQHWKQWNKLVQIHSTYMINCFRLFLILCFNVVTHRGALGWREGTKSTNDKITSRYYCRFRNKFK